MKAAGYLFLLALLVGCAAEVQHGSRVRLLQPSNPHGDAREVYLTNIYRETLVITNISREIRD